MVKAASRFGLWMAVLLIVPACGGSRHGAVGGGGVAAKAQNTRYAYAAGHGDDTITLYRVDSATGVLKPSSYFTTPGQPNSIAVSRSKFLYATLDNVDQVAGFSIQAGTGALVPVPGAAFATGSFPSGLVIDSLGKFLYVSNSGAGTISGYQINAADGSLTPVPGSPVAAGTSPAGIGASPVAGFVFVCNLGSASLSVFSLDPATGALTEVTGSPFSTARGPISATVDPSGHVLYVANAFAAAVSSYAIDAATGALTPLAGSPTAVDATALDVAIDPSGRFALVDTLKGVSVFSLSSSGALSFVAGPFSDGTGTIGVTIEAAGRYAYVVNQTSQDVSTFALDGTAGALRVSGRATLRGNTQSRLVTVSGGGGAPQNSFAYVTNFTSNTVSAFSVDPVTGAWTGVTGSPFATGIHPQGLAVDPSNKYLFAANGSNANVSVFAIDAGTGVLTAVAGSPFSTATSPAEVLVDPSGRFVYVACLTGAAVMGYSLDPSTGALTAIPGSPFSTGGLFAHRLTINPAGHYLYAGCFTSPPGQMLAYRIDAFDGSLTAVTGSPFIVGNVPFGPTIDPWGTHLYLGDQNGNSILGFTLQNSSGAITAMQAFPVATPGGSYPLQFSPSGELLYDALAGLNSISAFAVNPLTGTIARELTGSPFAAGTVPTTIAIGPGGRFLYASNQTSNDVSGFTIDPSTGALTPLSGFPVAVGTAPTCLVVTGTAQ